MTESSLSHIPLRAVCGVHWKYTGNCSGPKQSHCIIFYLAAVYQIVTRCGKQITRKCSHCGHGWRLSGVERLSDEGFSRKNRLISTIFRSYKIAVFSEEFGERASNFDKCLKYVDEKN